MTFFQDPLYATPLAFDIVVEEDFDTSRSKQKERFVVPSSATPIKQPAYNFGTTQIQVFLEVGGIKMM